MLAVAAFYSNTAIANTLGATINTGATSLYFTTSPVGYPGSFPFNLRLEPGTANEEIVQVASGAGTVGTPYQVTRGFDGTTAKSHNSGTAVQHGMIQNDLALSRTHENSGSGSGVHGLPSSAWLTSAIALLDSAVETTSTVSVVTWTSIPQTYNHLLLVVSARSTFASTVNTEVTCALNGDSSSVYSFLDMKTDTYGGSLTAPGSGTAFAQALWNNFMTIPASLSGTAVNTGGGYAVFPNYSRATMNKFALAFSGMGTGTTSLIGMRLRACFYNPTSQAGITQISLSAANGNFVTGSSFFLYGLL